MHILTKTVKSVICKVIKHRGKVLSALDVSVSTVVAGVAGCGSRVTGVVGLGSFSFSSSSSFFIAQLPILSEYALNQARLLTTCLNEKSKDDFIVGVRKVISFKCFI